MSDKVRKSHRRSKPYQQMHVIAHTVYRQHLLPLVPDDSSYVLVNFFLVFRLNQSLPFFYGKDYLDIYLCITIRHHSLLNYIVV